MAFNCCCCDHRDFKPVGQGVVRGGDGRTLIEGPLDVSSRLVSCADCSHVSVHPVPPEEELSKMYQGFDYWKSHGVSIYFGERSWLENLNSNGGLWERYERAARLLEIILDHSEVSDESKIIDLASGLAPFLYHCRQRGFKDLYALEPSAGICRFLSDQGITAYPMLLEDFIAQRDLPRFDVMFLSHALEHLRAPDEVLKGLRELLSDQGVLFIAVPYQDHLNPWTPKTHLHFFNEVSMAHLLKKCGYRAMFVKADKNSPLEKALIKVYHLVVGTKKKVSKERLIDHQSVQSLHSYLWRPLKRLLRLNVNIYVSNRDLLVMAGR